MITILLAWINAKYKAGYEGVFILGAVLDCLGMILTIIAIEMICAGIG